MMENNIRYDLGKIEGIDEFVQFQLEEKCQRIMELEEEEKRLDSVIDDLHDEIRKYDRKVKRQSLIITNQRDLIATLMELVGLIEDEF